MAKYRGKGGSEGTIFFGVILLIPVFIGIGLAVAGYLGLQKSTTEKEKKDNNDLIFDGIITLVFVAAFISVLLGL